MNKLDVFLQKSKKIHGDKFNYSLVDYKNNKTKIKIICPNHGVISMTPSSHHTSKYGCSKCSPNYKSNKSQFIKESISKHGKLYDYSIVEYKNSRTHVEIICHKHNDPFIFKQTPYKHTKQGQGCPLCAGKYSYGYKMFIEKSKKIHGGKYKYDFLKKDYIDNKAKVRIECYDHGIFKQSPNSHLGGRGCPLCSRRAFNTKEDFIRESNIVHDNKYDYSLVKFNSLSDEVTIICPTHGEFDQVSSNHVYGSGCRKCSGCEKYTQESIINKFKDIHGDKYDYSKVNFKSINKKVTIICSKHGEFNQIPFSHYNQGSGCPKCNTSKGESEVLKILDNLGLNYTYQHIFEDCKGMVNYLPFDFYLPNFNIAIEYDGKQHFEVNDYFGGVKGFIDLKINDTIKNKYCQINNIKLLRISYKDFNKIEDIIKFELSFK